MRSRVFLLSGTLPLLRLDCRVGDLYLLAFQAIEGRSVARVKVGALRGHPPLALVAQDPLLAVVAESK